MKGLLRSRAGSQLFITLVGALAVWLLCQFFRVGLIHLVDVANPDRAFLIISTLVVIGSASFTYSGLRLLDMRTEMLVRRRAFEKADHIATHDNLTKLPNRYGFERFSSAHMRVPGELADDAAAQTMTIFSIDLDGFKKVNDLLGHHGGDILLVEVARRLCSLARHECVFRFGGDEFVVAAQDMTCDKEEQFAKLLIHAVSRPVLIDQHLTEVGASVGLARFPEDGETLEEVCHRSDVALYESKSRGRNRFTAFRQEMQEKVLARALLERELRLAIDKVKIAPFYQPLVDIKSGRICGFEALARWQRDDLSFVQPDRFIQVAEETGLITTLCEQLLRQACADAAAWPDGLILSFNLSPIQIEDRLLVSRIRRILDETGLQSSRLEIEITENALVGDPDRAAIVIEQLHASGIQVALDDFGTGYSSLSQLARFQFDKIKIDKSFVSGSAANEKNEKIVDAIMGLGRSLNLKITVEGIEEHKQLAYFVGHGCDVGQGYLFGKAMPSFEVLPFLDSRSQALKA